MGKILTSLLLTMLAASHLCGCNTSGCTDNQSALPLAGLYSSSGQAVTVNTIDISGVGAPGDSLLYASGTTLEKIYLPLRSNAEVTSFCFHYDQEGINGTELNDTITFRYTSSPYFASEECGAMLTYHITELTHTSHLIQSVELTDPEITNVDLERIKIYFKTSE